MEDKIEDYLVDGQNGNFFFYKLLRKPAEIVFTDGPQIESITVKTEPQNDKWVVTLTAWFGPSLFQTHDNLVAHFYWSNIAFGKYSVPVTIRVANKQKHSISFSLPKVTLNCLLHNSY